MDGLMDRRTDGQIRRGMDGWMHGLTDGLIMDEWVKLIDDHRYKIYEYAHTHTQTDTHITELTHSSTN